jgi:hypothetical protein
LFVLCIPFLVLSQPPLAPHVFFTDSVPCLSPHLA